MDQIEQLAEKLNIKDVVKLHGNKSLEEIARAIVVTDLGVIPNKRTSFTEINMPTRIFEYLAMGKPVIVPSTIGIRDYFNEDNMLFFEPDNFEDLARQILRAYDHPDEAATYVKRGRSVYSGYLWVKERRRFITLVEGLLSHTT
jgi:glycosyltransferase involved in cell wall biosynthesis